MSLEERFWAKAHKGDGCWEWTGARMASGYGRINAGDNPVLLAHRVSWELRFGPIPDGLWVLHRCDNPPCVNPAHLFLGTRTDNMRDSAAKGRHGSHRNPWLRRGERNGMTKLTDAQVKWIREQGGTRSQASIAADVGVSQVHVSRVLRGESRGYE